MDYDEEFEQEMDNILTEAQDNKGKGHRGQQSMKSGGGNSYGSGTDGKEEHRSQYNRYMADSGKSPKEHMNMNMQFQ